MENSMDARRDGRTIIVNFVNRIQTTARKTVDHYGLPYIIAVLIYIAVLTFDLYPSQLECNNNFIKFTGVAVIVFVYLCFKLYCDSLGESIVKTKENEVRESVDNVFETVGRNTTQTMVQVFIWLRREDNIGHASLQLWDNAMTYISHWPTVCVGRFGDPRKKLEVLARSMSLMDDMESEAMRGETIKYPDIVIVIPDDFFVNQNIDNIKTFYQQYTAGTPTYKLKLENCADMIQEALAAGGFKLLNPIARVIKLGLTTPSDIGERIIYTYAVVTSHPLIRILHSMFEFSVHITFAYVVKVCLAYIGDMRIADVAPVFIVIFSLFLFSVIRTNG